VTLVLEYVADAISLGILYALLALGVGLIFGIMGLVNFAHGAYITVAAYMLFAFIDLPWPATIALVLLSGMVLALMTERVAFRPLRGADGSTLMITSFTVSFLVQSLIIAFAGSGPKSVDIWPVTSESLSLGGVDFGALDLIMLGTGIVLLGGLWLFLTRTRSGLTMRAAAADFEMLRLLGGRADRVVSTAFVISGLLAAVAGILLVSKTATVSPVTGINPVLIGFVATVIGGLNSVFGAAVGGFLLGALTVVLQVVLPDSLVPYREAFLFAVVIALLIVQPQGLMGSRAAMERQV
jgi:branched-chain amino acid transport system permease protein